MDEDDEKAPVREGDILAGKFRVERVLGVGGVGIVVAATHVDLDQQVALKFLRPSALRSEEAVERFLREARAVVRMKSEHAVKVLDVGKLENGAPYMVMELLVGCDFAQLMNDRGQLPIAEAVDYVLQACEALAEAHQLGIVHRDLKPENLFLTTGADHHPLVKVLDFGLLKMTGAPAPGRRQRALSGTMVMGTPSYMSPEQWTATSTLDARSDIWAVGVVLYELLAGRLPFEAEAVSELIAMVARDGPVPISAYRDDVPFALWSVILRCLEKDPEKRFSKVSKLAASLAGFVGEAGPHSIARISRTQLSVMPPRSAYASTPDDSAALGRAPSGKENLPTQNLAPSTPAPWRSEVATDLSATESLTPVVKRKVTARVVVSGIVAGVLVAVGCLYAVFARPSAPAPELAGPPSALPPSVVPAAVLSAIPSLEAKEQTPPRTKEGSSLAATPAPSVASHPKPIVKAPKKDAGATSDADRRLLETR